MTRPDLSAVLRLYLIADPDGCVGPLLPAVEAARAGGVTAVQLRAKSLTDRELVTLVGAARTLTVCRSISGADQLNARTLAASSFELLRLRPCGPGRAPEASGLVPEVCPPLRDDMHTLTHH